MVYVNITHIKRLLFYRAYVPFLVWGSVRAMTGECAFSGLGQRTSYDWRATALKLSLKTQRILVRRLLENSIDVFRAWQVQCIVRPHPDY